MSTPYIGSKISLISKSEIRYEGILYTVDTKESTMALAKVRSFGTESRPTETPMPPREDVYEYIIFKASDVKDLTVCETPQPAPQLYGGLPYDPAILKVSQVSSIPHAPGSAPFPPAEAPSGHLAGLTGVAKVGLANEASAQSESALNRETSPKTEAASQTNARPPQNRAPTAGGQNFRRGRRGGGQSQNQGQRTQQNFNRPGGGHRQQTVSGSSGGGGGGFGQFGGGSGFQQRDMTPGGFRGRGGGNVGRRGNFYGPLNGPYYWGGFPQNQHPGGGRGGSSPFIYRGGFGQMRGGFGSGGGGGGQQQQRWSSQPRTNQQRGASGQGLKFDNDYDFEKANEQFQETLSHLKDEVTSKAKIDENKENEPKKPADEGSGDVESPVSETNEVAERNEEDKTHCYDKNKSFFDCISCEALERQQGKNTRLNWKRERELNTETFGQAALRNYQFRRGGGIRYGLGAGRGIRRGYNSGRRQ